MLDFFIFWGGQTVHSVHFIKNRPVWSPESPPSLQELLRRRLQLLYSLGKTKWLEIPPSTRIGLPKTRDQISICLASNSWLSLKLFGKNMALALSGSFPGCPTDPTVFSCQAMKISGYGLFQNVLELISRHCTFQPDHGMSLWNTIPEYQKNQKKNLARRKVVPRVCQQNIFSWTWMSWMSFSCHEWRKTMTQSGQILKLEKTPLHFSHQQGLLRSQVCMQRPLWSWRSGTWDRVGGLFMDALVQNMVEYV